MWEERKKQNKKRNVKKTEKKTTTTTKKKEYCDGAMWLKCEKKQVQYELRNRRGGEEKKKREFTAGTRARHTHAHSKKYKPRVSSRFT